MHISGPKLRAKLDGELPAEESLAVERHLSECARCRARSVELARTAGEIKSLFSELPEGARPDIAAAFTRTQARVEERREVRSPRSWLPARMAPAWGAVAAIAVAVVLMSSPTARAAAQKFLAFLRVKNVVAIPVDQPVNQGNGQLISEFLTNSVTVTKAEKAIPVGTRDEAAKAAGFAVRLPAALSEQPELVVEGEHEFNFNVDLRRAQTLLGVLGRPDLKLPANLDGARVAVSIPRGILAKYGKCEPVRHGPHPLELAGNCIMVAQVPAPAVVTMPQLNLAEIAEIALQFTGMTAEEARNFARTVDWSSTLAIPVPTDMATHETVTVDGEQGVLMTAKPRSGRPTPYALVWVHNGIVHKVGGWGNATMALPVAQSLQ